MNTEYTITIECTNCYYKKSLVVTKQTQSVQFWCRKCHQNNVTYLQKPTSEKLI